MLPRRFRTFRRIKQTVIVGSVISRYYSGVISDKIGICSLVGTFQTRKSLFLMMFKMRRVSSVLP